jgi:queuosine biosynthesis protein QueD
MHDPGQRQEPVWVELRREYRFEAAHCLPRVPEDHPCRRLHGHNYRIEVELICEVNPDTGWGLDFYDLDCVVLPHIRALDHRYLNDLPGLENATSEVLCVYLWQKLCNSLDGLSKITVWETRDASCVYRGPRVPPLRLAKS